MNRFNHRPAFESFAIATFAQAIAFIAAFVGIVAILTGMFK